VEEHASRRLTDRFKLARDNPASTGKIFDDIGYLGDTTCSRAILEGTYDFPPEMDPHLRMLFEEAHRIFSLKSTEEISNFVSTEDFQYFWSRADETIQSSYSHIHFGHYKAIARDKYLSALQAAKLSLAAKTGIPMERWGHSLTILLEKEFGNIYIDKMRAICLMEADFNWLNKLVFAKRMMDQAYDAGIVPVEQFARRGVQSAHGVLCKILFCDMMRALHLVAGLPSVDLGNCYDAVAHPIASIALQALKVPLMTVVLALSVMQTMTFYLRTGYGVSQQGYGGTVDDPSMGLGQGNGMAPSGFQSVSTLMVNSYRRLGHASEFSGAWSGIMFCLAAILYVDDTDLLIVAKNRDMTLDEFFEQSQSAVMDWGLIVQATGGYLKDTKCFWYMMAWQWKNGVPSLHPLRTLPNYQLLIPQKSGPPVPIPMKDVTHCEETLGVWSCPTGDFGVHIEKKMKDGHLWAERLRRNRPPPADGWMGFRYALMPSMTYGFSAITPDLDMLEKSFNKLYRDVLSPLRVNQNITKFYRMAPQRVQGLGMPNPGIVMLSQKLHLLQSQWDQPTTTGNMLRQSLEIFQMELGLSSNILEEDFDRLGHLALHGWWKHLWELCHKYKVSVRLSRKYLIPLLRENDRTLMDIWCSNELYGHSHKLSLNRVRKYKGFHGLGDITLADGVTIDPFALTDEPSDSSRVFSVERPTRADFKLFRIAIRNLSSAGYKLPRKLGKYISSPHRPDKWFVSDDRDFLYYYYHTSNSSYVRYVRDFSRRSTRGGTKYIFPTTCQGQFPWHTRASVRLLSDDSSEVELHSTATVYIPSKSRQTFLQRLASLPNQSLWRTFECDGDGEWIYNGLLRGSLVMVSDGSYNKAVGNDVCSCAAAILCTATNQRASVTWVEKSDRFTADNYRAELLGAIALQLMVKTATDGKYISRDMRPRFGCDKKGVVHHGNHPRRPMPMKQSQADVLRYYKKLVRDAPFKCRMYHVFGHLDELLSLSELTIEEKINICCDQMAEEALHQSSRSHRYISRVFPEEDLVFCVDGVKISGATTPAISRHWGDEQAREHYHSKGILDRDLFDEVYWDGIEQVMKQSPTMFGVWVTKQVSGFCGTNHMLNTIYGTEADVCPNCGTSPERATHVFACRDPGRASVFYSSVDSLLEWMQSSALTQSWQASSTATFATAVRSRCYHSAVLGPRIASSPKCMISSATGIS
jgi:hypothetical protein